MRSSTSPQVSPVQQAHPRAPDPGPTGGYRGHRSSRTHPQGPQGPATPVVTFRQATPAATWTILHSLASKPSVVVLLDSDPTVPVVTDVFYPDLATVVLEFLSPESGYAYL
jgi:hypothetical protein